jgi:uncharacterized protein YndB with AHSA1/START domain
VSEKLEPIAHVIDVDVPLDHLWHVMTDAATVPQWLGCMNYEPRLGHTFHMQPDGARRAVGDIAGATHCDVTSLAKPLFAFSWYMPGTPKTNVSFRLAALEPGKTRVVFAHDGWDQFPAEMVRGIRDMLQGGWTSVVLPNLAKAAMR